MRFTKMHGLGNDHIYIDCYTSRLNIKSPSMLAKILCNRHFGVGADGIVLIYASKRADFKIRAFNSDGSEAQILGNGIRCVRKICL